MSPEQTIIIEESGHTSFSVGGARGIRRPPGREAMRKGMRVRVLALATIVSLACTGLAWGQGYNVGQPPQPSAQPVQPGQPQQPVQPGQAQEDKEYYPGVSPGGIPIMNQWLKQQEEQERLRQTRYGLDPYMYDRPASRSYR